MQEYSKRLGIITDEQFQAALDRLELGQFIEAEPVPFGLFGQNVFLTSSQGKFVFRGCPHYPWQFPTERFFVNQLHERTHVPVAYPYLLEPSTDIFGWSFVIMPRLPGLQLHHKVAAARLPMVDRRAIARALARTLVEVQRLTWKRAGQFDPESDKVRSFDKPYLAWVVENIRRKAEDSKKANDHTKTSDMEWIEKVISENLPVPVTEQPVSIVLGDYGEHNVLVMKGSDGWQVSALFDLMTAHFGDGLADLSLPVRSYIKNTPLLADFFVEEYLQLKPQPEGFARLEKIYMLDMMLSFWRYWQTTQGSMPGEQRSISFEHYARLSVEYWDKYM